MTTERLLFKKSILDIIPAMIVTVATCILSWQHIYIGWFAHDEGLLGHTAERVLQGELPHVDFQDTYTGGLAYIHALIFKFFGTKLEHLRSFHAIVFTFFQLYFLLVSSRYLGSYLIASLAVFAFSPWAAPQYPASMPSWYVTYLSFFGISIICCARENLGKYIIAGASFGLALSLKITALYFIIAGFQIATLLEAKTPSSPHQKHLTVFLLLISCLIPLGLTYKHMQFEILTLIILPHFILTAAILKNYPHLPAIPWKSLAAISIGIFIGICPLITQYGDYKPIAALLNGIFILPQSRLHKAFFAPPALAFFIVPITYTALYAFCTKQFAHKVISYCSIGIIFLAIATTQSYAVLTDQLVAMSWMTPTIFSIYFLLRPDRIASKNKLMFWLIALNWSWLTLYPYSAVIYLYYNSCFILIVWALYLNQQKSRRFLIYTFIVLGLVGIGYLYGPDPRGVRINKQESRELMIERAHLYIKNDKHLIEEWLELIISKTSHNSPILAFPDNALVYFLCNRRNPTPIIFDFFYSEDYSHYKERIIQDKISLIAINLEPSFSNPLSAEEKKGYAELFKHSKRIGNQLILWND